MFLLISDDFGNILKIKKFKTTVRRHIEFGTGEGMVWDGRGRMGDTYRRCGGYGKELGKNGQGTGD